MIGRTEEMRVLKDAAGMDRSQFIVVYGRRRVGKTYLIRETFDYSFTFAHTGIEGASMHEQLEAFRDSLSEQGLADVGCPKDWIEAFSLLKKLLKSSHNDRKVVFIDELPWMDTPRSRFVRALEHFWNGWCSARKDIVLVVCGSATSWMIRTVLRNKGGLFNRANRVLCLEPFTLRQCEEYMKDRGCALSRYEIAEGYMVFGGSPYYWSLLDRSLPMAQNIDRLCFTASGELTGVVAQLAELKAKLESAEARIAELKGGKEAAEAKVAELEMSAETEKREALVGQALAEGRITNAQAESLRKLDSAALGEFLKATPGQAVPNGKGPAPKKDEGELCLTAEEKDMAKTMGISQEEMLKAKKNIGE